MRETTKVTTIMVTIFLLLILAYLSIYYRQARPESTEEAELTQKLNYLQ